MLDLDPRLTAVFAVAACAAVLLLALVVLVLAVRLRRLRRHVHRAFDGDRGDDLVGVLGRHEDALGRLHGELADLDARSAQLRELVAGTVSRVGLVRYDAFEDMGGALSFSAALLDERGDGVVVSAINGRSETRCYAKDVRGGVSAHHLTAEEEAAVGTAVSGGGTAEATVPQRRGRRRTS